MKYITTSLILVLVALSTNVFGQSHSMDSVFYKYYLKGNIEGWKKDIRKLEQLPQSLENLNALSFAQYGYLGFLIDRGNKKVTQNYLDDFIEILEKRKKHTVESAALYAMQGACYGIKIMYKPFKAPSLGGLSKAMNDTSMMLDSTLAYCWFEKANLTYGMPSFLGGGTDKAIPILRKAVVMMEEKGEAHCRNWIYLLAKYKLIQWLDEEDQKKESVKLANELFAFEPNFIRVKPFTK